MTRERAGRVFLSYASSNRKEVLQLDRELRLRGVPLWRDRVNLAAGKELEDEIRKAEKSALGFVVYLTPEAVASEWVREKEIPIASETAEDSSSFGIVPIFCGDPHNLVQSMLKLSRRRTTKKAISALENRNGYVMSGAVGRNELRQAADRVLESLLGTLAEKAGLDQNLRIGFSTRGGPGLSQFELDLLVDWSTEYPESNKNAVSYLQEDQKKSPPEPLSCNQDLLPALESLRSKIVTKHSAGGLRLKMVPQCHLSMAMAVGFTFRRNTGFTLEIVNPFTHERSLGPNQPEPASSEAWHVRTIGRRRRGTSLVLAVNVSRDARLFKRECNSFLSTTGIDPAISVILQPAQGPSKTVLAGKEGLDLHRMAVAVADQLTAERGKTGATKTHFLYAGPAALAILIAQQLSNVGPVQTYEWLDDSQVYTPAFVLAS